MGIPSAVLPISFCLAMISLWHAAVFVFVLLISF